MLHFFLVSDYCPKKEKCYYSNRKRRKNKTLEQKANYETFGVFAGKLCQVVLGVTTIGIPRFSRTVGKLTMVSSSATHLQVQFVGFSSHENYCAHN
jgi:hypothetical protein